MKLTIGHGQSESVNLLADSPGSFRISIRIHYYADHETSPYRHLISGSGILEIDNVLNANGEHNFISVESKNSGICYEYDENKTYIMGKDEIVMGVFEHAERLYLEIYNNISNHPGIIPTGARIPVEVQMSVELHYKQPPKTS